MHYYSFSSSSSRNPRNPSHRFISVALLSSQLTPLNRLFFTVSLHSSVTQAVHYHSRQVSSSQTVSTASPPSFHHANYRRLAFIPHRSMRLVHPIVSRSDVAIQSEFPFQARSLSRATLLREPSHEHNQSSCTHKLQVAQAIYSSRSASLSS